jgi:Protein of unknown function (DUF3150)
MTNNNIASPLARKATLVSVEISQWTARKFDKKATADFNRRHHAAQDAGRYNKHLIQAERLKTLNSLVNKARELHYRFTKPWNDEGGLRILPNTLHAKFADEFRVLQRDFDEAADDFARDYPKYVEEQRVRLNGLFDPTDYPRARDIRDKFKLRTRVYPVPETDDFRSGTLDEATLEDIKREIAEAHKDAEKTMTADTVKQIVEVVGKMSDKLKAYNGGEEKRKGEERSFFANSLVGNVRQLAEMLPHFNLNNDKKLDAVIKRINKELCVEDAETLRENADVRASVQKSAEEIAKTVEDLLG